MRGEKERNSKEGNGRGKVGTLWCSWTFLDQIVFPSAVPGEVSLRLLRGAERDAPRLSV